MPGSERPADAPVRPRRRGRRIAGLAALTVLALVTLTGCTTAEFEDKFRFGWPRGVTEQAEKMRVLWTWSGLTALAVGVVVWALIFWCCIVYRRRKGTPPEELPRQTKYNLPIEWVYTIVPFFLIIGLFFYTVRTQNFVNRESANPDCTVQVDAFKWNWQFQYLNCGGNNSNFAGTETPVNTVGTSDEVPILLVPVNKNVKIIEHSYDVIHSFWVPEFLFKRDVIPHGTNDTSKDNTFQFTATKEGSYVGRCAELCGTYHSQMNFEVRVVSMDVYQDYLDALAKLGPDDASRQSEALTSVGLAPYSTTTHPFYTDRTARQASGTQVDVNGLPGGN
ncbi:aa3-type cytochrome oxidase subunit II [Jatrophihabitans sp. YIM 134969]